VEAYARLAKRFAQWQAIFPVYQPDSRREMTRIGERMFDNLAAALRHTGGNFRVPAVESQKQAFLDTMAGIK
jgi:hypothetical protein